MPRIPPHPLCLPELLADPQTKADYIQANPPRYGNSRPSSYAESSIPPSPSSMYGFDSHRHSRTTSSGSPSPPSTASLASTHTSLSIHNGTTNGTAVNSKRSSNLSQSSDKDAGNRSSRTWSIGNLTFGGNAALAVAKPRATWTNNFKTKSWFGNVTALNEAKQTNSSHQPEIKLSPSMIAAAAETEVTRLSRPLSSPYPVGNTTRSPRIGVGLQYYTEKNPAPPDIRKQIPDPIGLSDSEHSPTIPTLTNPRPPDKSTTLSVPSHLMQSLLSEKPFPGIRISYGNA